MEYTFVQQQMAEQELLRQVEQIAQAAGSQVVELTMQESVDA